MTKNEKRYLRHVKSFMPVKGKTERRFLHSLRSDLDEFSTAHPDSSYETLTQEFGSPLDMFYSYLSEQNSGLLIKQVKLRKLLIRIFIAISLMIILSLGIYTGHLIREYDNAMDNTVGGYTNTIEIIETSE
mgnify:FL=1